MHKETVLVSCQSGLKTSKIISSFSSLCLVELIFELDFNMNFSVDHQDFERCMRHQGETSAAAATCSVSTCGRRTKPQTDEMFLLLCL